MWIAAALLVELAGCGDDVGIVADAGEDARVVADAAAPLPTDFACIGRVVWPLAPAPTLAVSIRFYWPGAWLGGMDHTGFAGLLVNVCAADTDCTDSALTDALGDAHLTLPTPGTGFDGYLYATAPGRIPMRVWLYPPIADASNRWLDPAHQKAVLSAMNVELLHGGAWTYDASRATVIATTINCAGELTDAPFVTLDGVAPPFARAGDSVWFDVSPGTRELLATLPDTGEEIARIAVQARAGEIAALNFGPMPR